VQGAASANVAGRSVPLRRTARLFAGASDMHFELMANNNPRIWTKHAGVEVDPRENERLLEARARDYSAAKSLPYGGPFEPLMKPGYVAKAEHLPTTAFFNRRAGKRHPPFWFFAYALSIYTVIAPEFRDALLALEPDYHQLFPLDIWLRDRSASQRWYIINTLNNPGAIDVEKSNWIKNTANDGSFFYTEPRVTDKPKPTIFLKRSFIQDRHFWRDGTPGANCVFVSDTLVTKLESLLEPAFDLIPTQYV